MGTHPVLVTAHRPVLTLVPQIFLCTDLWKDTETLRAAYHDSKGVTEAFIKNGIQPEDVAGQVFEAIKNDQFYIVPAQPNIEQAVETRLEDIRLRRNPTIASLV